jgi:holo-[acyl-carrier protein] synthase
MLLSGGAVLRLEALLPPGMAPRIDLTMTDEYPYAYAQVIISAVA